MNFGFPQFFWALIALSIPLLIHLFNLRRPKTILFSNTRFLKQLEQEQRSVKRLRHWLILLLRGLALAAIVTAFTLPYQEKEELANSDAEQLLHLYIDNSLSMQRDGSEGPLLNQAKLISRDFLSGLNEGNRVQVICNDPLPRYQRYYSASEAQDLIEQMDYSPAIRNFESILSKIRDLEKVEGAKHEILFISDFQESLFGEEKIELPDNEQLNLMALEAVEGKNNVSIDSLSFKAPVFVPGLNQEITVHFKNHGKESLNGLSLEFLINDTLQQAQIIDLEAEQAASIDIEFTPLHQGFFKGEVRVDKGEPDFDNHFYFSFQTLNRQKVYFLSEQTETSLPLKIFQNEYFELKTSDPRDVDYDFLADSKLLILQSDLALSESLKQQFSDHLNAGKNIWLFPAKDAKVYQGQLANFGIQALGSWQEDSLMAQEIALNDPFLARSFEQSSKRPILPYSKLWLSLSEDATQALLSAGNQRPLLSRLSHKKGQVFFGLSSLDPRYGNLASHPVMVPLLANAALYSNLPSNNYLRLGEWSKFQTIQIPYQEEAIKVQTAAGALIPFQEYRNDAYQISLPEANIETGNYPLERNEKVLAYLSVNGDARESELQTIENPALQFEPAAHIIEANSESGIKALRNTILQSKTALWPWFISLALVFLILEMILLKFRKS